MIILLLLIIIIHGISKAPFNTPKASYSVKTTKGNTILLSFHIVIMFIKRDIQEHMQCSNGCYVAHFIHRHGYIETRQFVCIYC